MTRARPKKPAAKGRSKRTKPTQPATPCIALLKASPSPAGPGQHLVYLLSDSTGNLARHMMAAFATQFPPDAFKVQLKLFLNTAAKLNATLDEIARQPGIVLHAVVESQAKETVENRCAAMSVPVRDLTGRFVTFLSEATGLHSRPDVHQLHQLDDAYDKRIRALEFTIDHDDGLGLSTLHEAQIVLTGVSRTSKTPTGIYLSQLGYRVANVALAMEVAPPAELLALPGSKVVGLVIDPDYLLEIRQRRKQDWHMTPSSYSDPSHIEDELKWSRQLFRRQGWPILDVTGRAVEETAAHALALLGL